MYVNHLQVAKSGKVLASLGNGIVELNDATLSVTIIAGSLSHPDLVNGDAITVGRFRGGEGFAEVERTASTEQEQVPLVICDMNNHVLRWLEGGLLSTYCGSGQAGHVDGAKEVACFNYPWQVIQLRERLFVSEVLVAISDKSKVEHRTYIKADASRIRLVNLETGNVTTLAMEDGWTGPKIIVPPDFSSEGLVTTQREKQVMPTIRLRRVPRTPTNSLSPPPLLPSPTFTMWKVYSQALHQATIPTKRWPHQGGHALAGDLDGCLSPRHGFLLHHHHSLRCHALGRLLSDLHASSHSIK